MRAPALFPRLLALAQAGVACVHGVHKGRNRHPNGTHDGRRVDKLPVCLLLLLSLAYCLPVRAQCGLRFIPMHNPNSTHDTLQIGEGVRASRQVTVLRKALAERPRVGAGECRPRGLGRRVAQASAKGTESVLRNAVKVNAVEAHAARSNRHGLWFQGKNKDGRCCQSQAR